MALNVHTAGDGAPIVFLHGFPENGLSWTHQIAAVAEAGFSAWAPDLRGYNTSDRPAAQAEYHVRHLAADVAAMIRATGHGRAHLVGHDWGGIVAWTVAGYYPDLVDKLVICNAPHMQLYVRKVWRTPQLLRSWYVSLFLVPGVPEWLLSARDFAALRRLFRVEAGRVQPFSAARIDEYVAQFRPPGALTAALNYYRANVGDGTRMAAAARVRADTLVLWGDKDPALGIELLDGLSEVAPNVRVHRFADVGHWIQNEAPGEVNRRLVDFLTRPDRAGP